MLKYEIIYLNCILHEKKQPLLFLLFFQNRLCPHLSQKLIHLIFWIKFDPKVNPKISSTFFVNTNLILILILSLILSLTRFVNSAPDLFQVAMDDLVTVHMTSTPLCCRRSWSANKIYVMRILYLWECDSPSSLLPNLI